jgi:hypothetical protein
VKVAEMGLGDCLGRGGWGGTVRVGWGLRKVEEKWGRRVFTVAESTVLKSTSKDEIFAVPSSYHSDTGKKKKTESVHWPHDLHG